MLDHLNNLNIASDKRISLFGKIIDQQKENMRANVEVSNEPPSAKILEDNYKPIYTEKEKHLETIFGDNEDAIV